MLTCDHVQAALSARLDGEPTGIDDDVLDAHLSTCLECRAFYEEAARFNRSLAFGDATERENAPDLSEAILAGVEPMWRQQAATRAWNLALARVIMVLLGIGWAAWAIVLLIQSGSQAADALGNVDTMHERLLSEAAATRCALAFGLFFAAWQPRITGGLLPLFGALWTFSFGLGAKELIFGEFSGSSALQLGLLFLSVLCLLWSWLSHKGWAIVSQGIRSLTASPHS
ncbi:zf-HC2 domain-containing protein [Corynebacterium pseudotuberculosis]|uniref:zf-HC2 domain-containing protein n=1 Tax=Corynebacterium pseudotuberculosis TaxID=1719 RepID=UPI0002F86FB1|nr:zf-HC2 domain-containing protein [Corynebacterium pseudotuberculosis]ALU18344.1 hypothetical protein AN397_09620 [Corynebacterium pseudotuberculosis]